MRTKRINDHCMRGAMAGPAYCAVCLGHVDIDLPSACPRRPMNAIELANVRENKLDCVQSVWVWTPGVTADTMTYPVAH
jgi:hypothetical protein